MVLLLMNKILHYKRATQGTLNKVIQPVTKKLPVFIDRLPGLQHRFQQLL